MPLFFYKYPYNLLGIACIDCYTPLHLEPAFTLEHSQNKKAPG